MRAYVLRAFSLAFLAVAASWTIAEIFSTGVVVAIVLLGLVWGAAVVAGVARLERDRIEWERSSRIALGLAFFANRVALLGTDILAMSAFVALLAAIAAVQRYDRIFGAAYRTMRGQVPALREVDRAVLLGLARALGTIGLALALTLVAANAIVLGFAPFTSTLSALALALLFIVVVVRLARGRPSGRAV